MTLISSNKNRVNSFPRGLNRVSKTSSTKEAPKTHALTKDSFSKNDTLSKTSTPKINMGTHLSASNVKAGINVNRPQINHTKSKETEFDPRLTKNQKNAVIYSNKIAKENSQKARPELLQKIKKLGYSEKDLDKVLKYIREEAPLNINFHPDKKTRDNKAVIDSFIEDSAYKNQFETKISSGMLAPENGSGRDNWEKKLFGGEYHKSSFVPKERPKYGTFNPSLDFTTSKIKQYGLCYFVPKKSLIKRTTFTAGDSGNQTQVGTAKHFEYIINKLGDGDIKNVMETGLGKPAHSALKTTRYIEAQYHGPIEFSKDIEALIIDKKYENTPYEEKLRIFAKKNNISLKWKINSGLVLNDHSYKNNIKECDINPNSDSTNIIPKEKILFESTNITDNNSLQNLKNYNYILGALTIQNMDISTLKLPQLSYLRGEIAIKTTSGVNLSISKDLSSVKVPYNLLNTLHEKELRSFAKNNNLNIKVDYNGIILNDKKEYKLSELDPDILPNSTSNKTILKENIHAHIYIRNTSDIKQLKEGDCVLGHINIENTDISNLKLSQLSYVRDGINIKTTSGVNLSISKDLDSVEIPYNLLNTPHEKELRSFAKNNNLTVEVDYNGIILNDKKEYKLSELDPDTTSIKTILRENIQNKSISIRNASDVAQLKKGDCILGSLSIQSTLINTLKLPQLSYVRDGITITTTSGVNLSISKDLSSVKIPHTLLNTPHETEVRTFAKNNNLPLKWQHKDGTLIDDKSEYKLSEIIPDSTSIKTILRENIQNKNISIRASDIAQLKTGDCILGSLSIQSVPINTFKLPQVSYVRDGITIKATSGANISISKDLSSVEIPHTLLNTPHEEEARTFAKNNNLTIKWQHKDGTLIDDKSEYKLSEIIPDSTSIKAILRENIQNKNISIQASSIAQLKKGDCILGSLSIHSAPINTLKLPQLSYVRDGIAITTTSGANLSISKDFDTIKIPYNLLNTPHEKDVRTFAKNNNLSIKWERQDGTLVESKSEYKLSELDPNTTSIKTILRENIQNKSISIRNASDVAQLKKGDCILGSLSIQSTLINTLKLPQLSYVRDGIAIKTTSGINLSISKDFDTIKIPYKLLNTPHEKEVRTFAKNNNLSIKWERQDGTLVESKSEYKLSELDPNTNSNKTILRENIQNKNISISASNIAQLKKGDCILGSLSIQSAPINTLKIPQLSYVRDGITIKTTSGINLSISKDFDTIKIPYNLLNTPHEKEVRTFAKNNNLSIKWEHKDGTLIDDKEEYKLSEINTDIKQGSTSDKTILKENIRGSISIRNASDIAQLKTGDCILGGLSIQSTDINTLILPKFSYIQDGITIRTKSGANLSISKDLDSVKMPYTLLNTLQGIEVRNFARNNDLSIKWEHEDGNLIESKSEYKLSELDPNSNSNKTILKENIRGSISIRNASDITKLKEEDCILGSLNIQNVPINTLKIPQVSYARDGITITTTSGANLSISKNLDSVKIPDNLLNTPQETEVRTFAKNNNLPIKWQYKNGTLIDDKKEYKLSDLDPDSTSDKTISMKNIRGSISIRASDIAQLKKEDYILGSLSIQSASINTLKLPQLSYVRDGINIKITSGYNLFISKNLDTVHTPFNTSREKEIRDFAKNNNLTIKWQ